MEAIKSIVEQLNSRFLFANYSTPQAKKRGKISTSVYERRVAKPKFMSYDDILQILENDDENEIFSPPFQPYCPTDSDLVKYSNHTSESSSKNDSANNSSDEPDNKSDNDIDISTKTSDNETDPRPNPSRSLDLSLNLGLISETPTKPLRMFLAPPVFMYGHCINTCSTMVD